MKRKTPSFTFRFRILAILLAMILAFSLLSLWETWLSLHTVYSLAAEKEQHSLRHINLEISHVLSKTQDRTEIIAGNTALQEVLRKDLPEDMTEVYKDRLNMNHMLFYESIQTKEMDGIYILGENGAMFHATYSFRREDYRDRPWYLWVVENKEPLWLPPRAGSEIGNNLDFLTMSILVPIKDRASPRILGVAVSEILMEDLERIVFEDLTYDGIFCLLDEKDQLIYCVAPKEEEAAADWLRERPDIFTGQRFTQISDDLADEKGTVQLDTKPYVTVRTALPGSSWKVLCLSSVDTVFSVFYRLVKIILAAGILMALVWTSLSFWISAGLVSPIQKIQTAMKEVEKGDFSVRLTLPRSDELGDLGRGFNHMIGRINELIETERQTQEKLKRADFNALQAQINPHFLYNTLDSINWMARMNRTDKVESMIDSLTSFLRIGLSRGRVFITLREELRHVESYFQIQRERYSSLLSYEIDVPQELYGYQVIKMTLQPLVENALYHGIKEKDEPGTIRIWAKTQGESLFLMVEDDGMGMTQERLLQVQEMMRTGIAQNKDAYGTINVSRRIKSYFGEEYGIEFTSTYRQGTVVTVRLPLRPGEEDHV